MMRKKRKLFKGFIPCKVLVAKNTGINEGRSILKAWVESGFKETDVSLYHDILENNKIIGTMIYLKNGLMFHTDLIRG